VLTVDASKDISFTKLFFKSLVSSFTLFHWFYLNGYLILSYFKILDSSYSPHSLEEHWTLAHWTTSTLGRAASAGAAARLSSGGGTIRDCGCGT
jgi:hypothetical protein